MLRSSWMRLKKGKQTKLFGGREPTQKQASNYEKAVREDKGNHKGNNCSTYKF